MSRERELTSDVRLKIYPAVVSILGICLVASLLSRFEVQISTEPAPPSDRSSTAQAGADRLPDRPSAENTKSSEQRSPSPTAPASEQLPAAQMPAPSSAAGNLRVSNQTTYPVRVALLSLAANAKSDDESKASSPGEASRQNVEVQPVHWDFSPNEGGIRGLKLSLPNGNLRIQAGDVLVAFAEDGSRRYWGPFVVGKTASPSWDAAAEEWRLNLE